MKERRKLDNSNLAYNTQITVMTNQSTALLTTLRSEVLRLDGVTKLAVSRRFNSLYATGEAAVNLFFLDSGLVKLVQRGEGKEIIPKIVTPGEMFGVEALREDDRYALSAEVMQEGTIYRIPRTVFLDFCDAHPETWRMVAESLVLAQKELESKIELLCLHDVEYRILHYLAELAVVLNQNEVDIQDYSLPLSQSELASLIGATRETTSTTLNSLARRGLVRLGRRLLMISSPDEVRLAARNQAARAAIGG